MNDEIGVLFDMDGVIVDSNPWHKKALQIFFKEKGKVLSESDLATKLWGRANKDWIPLFFGAHYSAQEIDMLSQEKEAIYRKMHAPTLSLLSGLLPFLRALKEKEFKTTISTSAIIENVDFVLSNTGIAPFFDAIISAKDFKKGKPDPEVYLLSAQRLGLKPHQCVVIEDALAGVEAGLNANMKVIGVTTTHSADELQHCHLIINDFRELAPLQVADLLGL